MESRRTWRRTLAAVLSCAALVFGSVSSLRAEMLHCTTPSDPRTDLHDCDDASGSFKPYCPGQSVPAEVRSLRAMFRDRYERFQRSMLESMVTGILIKWGSPPPMPKGQGNEIIPPPQGGGENPPPPPPPPPPPGGDGESPPPDGPPVPPPPQQTPEPNSLLIGGIGASLASLVSWRRRIRRKNIVFA